MAVSFQTISVLILGIGLGLKHATEADHLAAISTIVSERRSMWSASLAGGIWGIGHTLSLLAGAFTVILLHIRIGERATHFLELCVAIMLVILGANVVRKVLRGGSLHIHAHQHGGRRHVHLHTHVNPDDTGNTEVHHDSKFIARPLIVGMIHGLAGTAALMLLVLSTISSTGIAIAYTLLFGVGSIGGMMFMSACISLPFRLLSNRSAHAQLVLHGLAGVVSVGLGLLMAYQIVLIDGIFSWG